MNKTQIFEAKVKEIIKKTENAVFDRNAFGGMIDREAIIKDFTEALEDFVEV